ncbi:MAG: bifunctional demethylmenaquinone methyltransferase/2-methoxy-6-polyprenyl-1,4-benzoquinol methylase UbiE [Bacteroides sp.]|nr:bifunctional demethylmenaquinone methyltransferase/2-methoxy-6-polyprenyl-1,4-benzoquinol methylase UbiE [Bacteroides sp.]MCM1412966.1 bifunctional demethylmenaquinone methyltransferase/2-methoxy-6-polyprenyl-1,4-benzoquinol methylase UbiE [Bacteroides sp.]MCM1471672.1 bifunctional demethylmenaquinone methyltransferase/2-methoxy-6-polyprenyl-1,4-benzoquinol methylase UbiE [Bacteroides sp.]
MNCESINPYSSDTRNKAEQVREMFDNIAPAYDFMNRAMTFGIDRRWRRKAVDMLMRLPHRDILDVASGTGDLAILLARTDPSASVTGIDLSEGMIEIGRDKTRRAGLADRITLTVGDCLNLPMADSSFDAVTVAYGVRNFENLLQGYRQMFRVLRPGGTLTVIELATPTSPLIKPLYRLYTRHIIPLAGRLVSKDVRAYSYLPESIAAVPQRDDMTALMAQAGFTDTAWRSLTFGTCIIYTARRPAD